MTPSKTPSFRAQSAQRGTVLLRTVFVRRISLSSFSVLSVSSVVNPPALSSSARSASLRYVPLSFNFQLSTFNSQLSLPEQT